MVALAVILISGCAGYTSPGPAPEPKDDAPLTSPLTLRQLARLPDPEVLDEPRSRGGNREVYTVLGKSYRVMKSARGFSQEGIASWYGTKFHGRKTANGERFDIYKLTAAHPHLPIPTYVRVTNLENQRQTIVRINDRGPFHDGRIIDLSFAAAVKLGFQDKGTARVHIEVIEPDRGPSAYLVQAGAYTLLQSADSALVKLTRLTELTGSVVKLSGDDLYRVRLGPVRSGRELERITGMLNNSEFGKPKLIPASGPAK